MWCVYRAESNGRKGVSAVNEQFSKFVQFAEEQSAKGKEKAIATKGDVAINGCLFSFDAAGNYMSEFTIDDIKQEMV